MYVHQKFFLPPETSSPCKNREDARKLMAETLDPLPEVAKELLWQGDGQARSGANPYILYGSDMGRTINVIALGEPRCMWWCENSHLVEKALRQRFNTGLIEQFRKIGAVDMQESHAPIEYAVSRHVYSKNSNNTDLIEASKAKQSCGVLDKAVEASLLRGLEVSCNLVLSELPEDFLLMRVSAKPLSPVPAKAGRVFMSAATRFVINKRLVGPWFVGHLRGRGYGRIVPTGRAVL
jgi:hypothetical protein